MTFPTIYLVITYRAKLLNSDWSMKRVFFLNFALPKGQNYSLTIGPQVAWQQLIQSRSFSLTMMSRFELIDEEYIEELKDKRENENKNKKKSGEIIVFKKWATERNLQANLEKFRKVLRKVREGCPWLTIVAVLSIQKFSNFALHVINK